MHNDTISWLRHAFVCIVLSAGVCCTHEKCYNTMLGCHSLIILHFNLQSCIKLIFLYWSVCLLIMFFMFIFSLHFKNIFRLFKVDYKFRDYLLNIFICKKLKQQWHFLLLNSRKLTNASLGFSLEWSVIIGNFMDSLNVSCLYPVSFFYFCVVNCK